MDKTWAAEVIAINAKVSQVLSKANGYERALREVRARLVLDGVWHKLPEVRAIIDQALGEPEPQPKS